jgi:hypothetical protein
MPFNTGIRDALSVAGNKPAPSMRDAIEREYSYVLSPAQNAADFVPGLTQSITFNGRLFARDDTDTTTPNDGVTCIVTSGGIRFKSDSLGQGAIVRRYAVLDIMSAPPGSPVVGNAYLIGMGATGAWATHDKKITSWTSAGWKFIVPKTYDEAHVADELQIYHYNGSSVWVVGTSAIVLADKSVLFTKLKQGLGLAVENQTTNTPPVSPSDGVAYIIGPSPTGVWTGHAFKVGYFINTAWLIIPPEIGWGVYDKNITADVKYTALGWQAQISGYSKVQSYARSGGAINSSNTYIYSYATAPSTANTNAIKSENYTAKKAGSKIEIDIKIEDVELTFGTTGYVNGGVFLDGAANAFSWFSGPFLPAATARMGFFTRVMTTLPDVSAHTFNLRMAGSNNIQVNGVQISIREHA